LIQTSLDRILEKSVDSLESSEEADTEGTVNVTFCWVVDLVKRLLVVIIQTVTRGLLAELEMKVTDPVGKKLTWMQGR
jgi:hypothetical protein